MDVNDSINENLSGSEGDSMISSMSSNDFINSPNSQTTDDIQKIAVGRRISRSNHAKFDDPSEPWLYLVISPETFNGTLQTSASLNPDPIATERNNLVLLMKLVVKELIETSIQKHRTLDASHLPLRHFFVLLEHIMRHGLKNRKSLLGTKKEVWHIVESLERFVPEACDTVSSVRHLPTVRSNLGKFRAWIRLAVMQKKLADYFSELVNKRDDVLVEYYENGSLMLSDQITIISGLLVGINILDCNFCIKDEDLDSQLNIIDFSHYLRDNIRSDSLIENGIEAGEQKSPDSGVNMAAVLDQKNYVEELNRNLSATVNDLQHKLEQLKNANRLMKDDLNVSKCELDIVKQVKMKARESHNHSNMMSGDSDSAKLSEDDTKLAELVEDINVEKHRTMEIEKELRIQSDINNEMEVAMNLLEKDVHERQDTIISLRQQLEDIKAINIQMYNKLQECENVLKTKDENIAHFEQKYNALTNTVAQLETRLSQGERRRNAAEEANKRLSSQVVEKEQRRLVADADFKSEKEKRVSLQSLVDEQQEQMTALQNEMDAIKNSRIDYDKLHGDYMLTKKKCADYELSLEELGLQLRDAKLEMDALKENSGILKEASWTRDKDADSCRQCSKPFSVSRRKHHCRNCGDIFCGACSDNKMPLPSFAKPMRVCDGCHTLLLERYSAH